jgi:hypothetical protein
MTEESHLIDLCFAGNFASGCALEPIPGKNFLRGFEDPLAGEISVRAGAPG